MEIVVSGKGIEITPALRSYTESKLNKLTRVFSSVMDAHVTLSVQKYLQIADVSVKTRNGGFTARAQTTDMYASINEAIDNLVKQARRAGSRIKNHKGHGRPARAEAWEEAAPEAAPEPPAGAEGGGKGKGQPRLQRERMRAKPLSLEEAMLQLRGSDTGFLFFRNAATSELNVVYRRKDGGCALIEPQ